ncbi:MAG: M3 family oligoendopeptidase [Eubacteriales bacterium]|nr:M3 family oligoendopeptidase [Eubacteriales bacterium]
MKFRDLPYHRPDAEAVAARMTELADALAAAADEAQAERCFLALDKADEDLITQYALAEVRNTMDLTDSFYEKEYIELSAALARMAPARRRVAEALCATPYRSALEKKYGGQIFRKAEAAVRLNCQANIPLQVREQELENEYRKTTAGFSCDFRGEKCNFYGLLRHMESPDAAERRDAAEAWARGYEGIAPALEEVYDKLVKLRAQMAANAGFSSYVEMAYLMRGRLAYGRAEVEHFRALVRGAVTPWCAAAARRQARRLGVDKLRFCDETLFFPQGNPIPRGTPEELISAAAEMYGEMSPRTGEFFAFMREHELFDLVTRPNKHMGGYCTYLPAWRMPFIFSNFNGTGADVDVLTHEAGHAYQAYESAAHQSLNACLEPSYDVAEIHSMSMEHLAYPWMKLFYGEEADRRVFAHLFDAFRVLTYLVCVDEFQHEVFDRPDMTPAQRRACWRRIERDYMPWRNYDGDAFLESGGYWMQKQHIFLYPFYYIDYALAQTCAFMMYRKAEIDRAEAWRDYEALCAAGGSKGYFELLETARLGSPFDEKTFADTVGFVTARLEEMEKEVFG